MKPEDFTTNNGPVQAELDRLHHDIANKRFSDVTDVEGHHYVDLVMEGGGMLGIALVGYVYTLEQVGIRFLQLGGTSAGSINALLMAAAGPKYEASSYWLLEILANKNFNDFVDGDSDVKDLISSYNQDSKWWILAWKSLQVFDSIREDFGLNPGKAFHRWLKDLLANKGVDTLEKLEALRKQGDDRLFVQNNGNITPFDNPNKLAFIAADITTQTKVVFPRMADLYWREPEKTNPADFVRASMSIPIFFYPYRIKNLPFKGNQLQRWRDVGYSGNVPDEVFFIDGGINSNFPIDVFHNKNRVPKEPTFGVKLGIDRYQPRIIRKVPQLLGAIFDSARQVHDFDFITQNPDYKHLVHCLDTEDFNWIDFNMPDTEKLNLFTVGVRGAANFLRSFNWEQYKVLREALLKAKEASDDMDSEKIT